MTLFTNSILNLCFDEKCKAPEVHGKVFSFLFTAFRGDAAPKGVEVLPTAKIGGAAC